MKRSERSKSVGKMTALTAPIAILAPVQRADNIVGCESFICSCHAFCLSTSGHFPVVRYHIGKNRVAFHQEKIDGITVTRFKRQLFWGDKRSTEGGTLTLYLETKIVPNYCPICTKSVAIVLSSCAINTRFAKRFDLLYIDCKI